MCENGSIQGALKSSISRFGRVLVLKLIRKFLGFKSVLEILNGCMLSEQTENKMNIEQKYC